MINLVPHRAVSAPGNDADEPSAAHRTTWRGRASLWPPNSRPGSASRETRRPTTSSRPGPAARSRSTSTTQHSRTSLWPPNDHPGSASPVTRRPSRSSRLGWAARSGGTSTTCLPVHTDQLYAQGFQDRPALAAERAEPVQIHRIDPLPEPAARCDRHHDRRGDGALPDWRAVPDRRHKLAGARDTPPPNPGGYGPFPPYACQAPNEVVWVRLWTDWWLSTDVA